MPTLSRLFCALLLALSFMAISAPKAAASCNNLICACLTTTLPVVFNSYDPTSTTDDTSTGSVSVTCVLASASAGSYVISLGQGRSNSYATRTLKLASSLSYNLYTTSSVPAPIWGDGTGGSQSVTGSFPSTLLNTQSFTVYGRIPSGQNVPPGAYTDTVTVMVDF
jgi:spore coat protein U-like protein